MAVNFKPSPKTFVKKLLGTSAGEMLLCDWAVAYNEEHEHLVFKSKKGLKVFKMDLPFEDLKTVSWNYVLTNHMPATKIAAYKEELNEVANFGKQPKATTFPPVSEKMAELSAEMQAVSKHDANECTEHEMANLPLIPLMQATRLLQPVSGTTGGTRYYYIGQYESGARLAVKYSAGGTLAIRMEGQNLSVMKKRWQEAGLEWNDSQAHQSAHLHPESGMDARKVIGSLLVGLSTQLITKVPNLEKLVK